MGTKTNPGQFDCYDAAEPDEPMFVLLARDRHATALVWLWTTLRELDGENPDKIAEARACCQAMLDWAQARGRPVIGWGHAAMAAMLELIRAANWGKERTVNTPTIVPEVQRFLAATRATAPDADKPIELTAEDASFLSDLMDGVLTSIDRVEAEGDQDGLCDRLRDRVKGLQATLRQRDSVSTPPPP